MDETLTVRRLSAADALTLSALLAAQSDEYMRYFVPFAFDEATVGAMLAKARRDLYMGLHWGDELAGFFMLRGWDDGYAVPAYGVTIAEAHRGHGLARLTLELARTICRRRGAERIMLKVHPDNVVAKGLYERAGYVRTGRDERNGNDVYHLPLGGPG